MSDIRVMWLILRAFFAAAIFCHATTIRGAPSLWVWALLVVAVWRLLVAFKGLVEQGSTSWQ